MTIQKISIVVFIAAMSIAPVVMSKQTTEEHHHHGTPVLTAPSPDNRWATDEPLRRGMHAIRNAVADSLQAYHQKTLTAEQAGALANTVDENIRHMIANCKLEPEADAVLHGLIGQMAQGANRIKIDVLAKDGLPQIAGALVRYPDYFEHAGWQPVLEKY
jgi:hypothetical protein